MEKVMYSNEFFWMTWIVKDGEDIDQKILDEQRDEEMDMDPDDPDEDEYTYTEDEGSRQSYDGQELPGTMIGSGGNG